MSQLTTYIKESYNELLQKVTWPSWSSLQESSVLVFVASLLIAGVVFAMDWAFGVNADGKWPGLTALLYDPSSFYEISFTWQLLGGSIIVSFMLWFVIKLRTSARS